MAGPEKEIRWSDCRRRNLEAVRTKGEAGGGVPPLVDPLLLGLCSLG